MSRRIALLASCIISMLILSATAAQSTAHDSSPNGELQQITINVSEELAGLSAKLPGTKLRNMPPLVDSIAAIQSPASRAMLQYLLDAELYYIKSSKQLVRAVKAEGKQYNLTAVLSGETLAPVSKSKIRKIKTNNKLRQAIRVHLARLDLSSENKDARLQAVQQIISKPSDGAIRAIAELVTSEQDEEVAALMQTVLGIQKLTKGSHQDQLAAVQELRGSLQPAVKNTMSQLLEGIPKEAASEQELKLAAALQDALEAIEGKRNIYGVIENIFFGVSLGSVLLLAAIGLAITFGVMGVINMAHGEMIMLGAYTTYVVQLTFPALIEYSLFIAIPAAFLVSGLVGVLIERGVIRYLKGRPLETLLATFGISLILQQLVRTIFSPLNRQVQSPEWMTGSWQINPVFSLTYNRLYIILFSLMVFFALLAILKKSSLGLHVRAVSQNRDMARALSVKSDWVDAITFGLGSGIAGIAGVVLSQLTNVGPNLGQSYIIDSFLVVVFGGVGNLWGTLVAAMSLGSVNKFLEPLTGSVLANIIVLVGLVLFIQKRPRGLFPQKGRAAD